MSTRPSRPVSELSGLGRSNGAFAALRGDAFALERAADPLHRAGIDAEPLGDLSHARAARLASAARMASSTLGLSAADPSACPHSGPAQSRLGPVPESSPAQTRRKRPSSETWPCLPAWWCRGPVGAGKDRSGARANRTGRPTRSCRLRPSRSTDQAITMSNWRLVASRQSASNAGACRGPWRR